MANIRSAKKRIRSNKTKTERNLIQKSKIKMFTKKITALVKAGNKSEAEKILKDAIKAIDMCCTKGIYHKNNAGRKVGRLTKLVNKI